MDILKLIGRFCNKYTFVLVVFVIWIAFMDSSSVFNWLVLHNRNKSIEEEIMHYNKLHETTELQLKYIKTDRDSIERIAREMYYMHAENEEVFLIE